MSGFSSKLMYDECEQFKNWINRTKEFMFYDFLLPKFENRKETNTLATCDGKYAHIE